ncbi:MAG: thiamine pyrophosphate-binding protein [Polyangiaceae bacterium]|nr:thiamine pyrophosphate-binding protein [Polyangiaceae bacterium]
MQTVVGGEVVAAMLAKEGVEKVFGIVDGTYLGFYASFEKYGIELVSPRHETCAAHMAGAYARLTGKLGVCMASNGPGVANILPGVAVENGEGNRVLLITSCRRQGIAYPDRGGTFQYFDQVAVTRPMTKWSGAASSFERIPEMMRRAFRISHRGRPGVVHVDIPENVMNGTFTTTESFAAEPSSYRVTSPIAPSRADVERVAELLLSAERPLLHAGSGVVHARAFEELLRVAELLRAPVSTSWGARGAIPEPHALALPTNALEAVQAARAGADLVLVLGSRLGETDFWGKPPYWGKASEQRFVQVDNDEEVLGLNRRTELCVLADCRQFLAALGEELAKKGLGAERAKSRDARLAELAGLRVKAASELSAALENRSAPMPPAHVPHTLRKLLEDDAILVVDGGNTAVWAQFFHEVRVPNTFLGTFKLGMLGAGVAQALGAKVAQPKRRVVCVLGDGAMGFHAQELETAVRQKLAVTYVVLCDRQWGMVKLTQQVGLGGMRQVLGSEREGTINTDFEEIRFDDLARSMGAHGERVASPDDLTAALRRALDCGGPAVVHVDVDPMLHLWAPGLQLFKDMHQEPAGE